MLDLFHHSKNWRGNNMGLFDAIVKTVINVATLPIAVAKDIVTCGNKMNPFDPNADSYTKQKLEQIKKEAEGK